MGFAPYQQILMNQKDIVAVATSSIGVVVVWHHGSFDRTIVTGLERPLFALDVVTDLAQTIPVGCGKNRSIFFFFFGLGGGA